MPIFRWANQGHVLALALHHCANVEGVRPLHPKQVPALILPSDPVHNLLHLLLVFSHNVLVDLDFQLPMVQVRTINSSRHVATATFERAVQQR